METKIIFTNGEEVESQPETLYVDCSTNSTLFPCYGVLEPIFQPGRITLNMIQIPQPTNSGGLIAALELLNKDDDFLNSVAKPVNAPQELEDWFRDLGNDSRNFARLQEDLLETALKAGAGDRFAGPGTLPYVEVLGFWWFWNHRLSGVN